MKKTLRVLLDTNIYEFLYKKGLEDILKLVESGKLIIYGCKVIRDELREIPKSVKQDKKSYRNSLLKIYDKLVIEKHSYSLKRLNETLAEEYLTAYKSVKGGTSKRKIFPDFLIVAVATIHRLDIVISEDDKTMKSRLALKAYEKVNKEYNFTTPNFISLKEITKL
jgi:rRNA-processing protein FCF1